MKNQVSIFAEYFSSEIDIVGDSTLDKEHEILTILMQSDMKSSFNEMEWYEEQLRLASLAPLPDDDEDL